MSFSLAVRTFRSVLVACLAFACLAMACQDVQAQRFNVEDYLKKIDSNKNGTLEPSEMSGRTKDFIRKMGVDVERPVSIRKVVYKANKDRRNRESEEAKRNAPPLKVPGFLDETKESTKILGFTTAASSSGSSTKVPEKIQKQIDDAMKRYDKNKDGTLDAREIRDGRWGSPDPSDSDTNKDGKLSRRELAKRYTDRESYYNKERNRRDTGKDSRSNRDSRSGRSTRTTKTDAQKKAEEREKFRNSTSSTTRQSSSRNTSGRSFGSSRSGSTKSTSSAVKSSSSSSNNAKYEDYVKGFFDQYDTDKSGALEKSEIAKMRRPPKADANGDGTITRAELMDKLTGKTKAVEVSKDKVAKSDSKDSKSAKKSDRSVSTSSKARDSGSRRSTRRSSGGFDDLDKNEDGRIHMVEFSSEWNDEIVKDFLEKDKNGDGHISLAEWNDR